MPTLAAVAFIVRQIQINPESAIGTDGGHVGDHLLSLFTETAWPSRAAEVN